jgi:Mlc titration factor MtfA (ptsG expression regulator)
MISIILEWLRARRRRKILATPFPDAWLPYLEGNLAHYRHLTPDEQARLRDEVRVFVAERNWEGCNGLTLSDEMKVTIAAHACLMTLGLEGEPFRNLQSVLVYPGGYAVPEERWYEGWSIMGEEARLGEAWYRGPVILSWAEVNRDARHPGRGNNLVWHEFAHQLDMLDRSTNGTPPLEDRQQRHRWHEVMTAEFNRLLDDMDEGKETVLDPYGAKNEAEFFAVATECFFDNPVELAEQHPRLYELLRGYYRQDTAARMGRNRPEA